MKVKTKISGDKVIINFDKTLDVVESKSVKIYDVKKIIIETIDVVLDCFDEKNKLLGSFFYRIDGKQSISAEQYKDDVTINLIENGNISEDIFRWNGD